MDTVNLKAARKRFGFKQRDVAAMLSMSPQRYQNYESGMREPDNDTLLLIAKVLSVTPNFLLGVSDPPYINMGERVSELCTEKGITAEQLAAALPGKIQTPYIKKVLAGWESPKATTLNDMAAYFGVSLEYLTGSSDIRTPSKTFGVIKVPVLGKIPAGIPIEAIEDIEDYEELPLEKGRGGREYFGLKIKGGSMSPDYPDGAVVIFLRADDCESGDDCAVIINGEDATFKKVVKQMDGIVLQPLNPVGYVPTFYNNDDVENLPVVILGIAVECRRKVGRFK